MNLQFLTEMYIPTAIAGGVVVGYIMKKWLPTDNKWIPTVLPVLGIIIACLLNRNFDISTIVAGAVSGLGAVGLHQAVTQHIDAGDIEFQCQEMEDEMTNGKGEDEDEV